jgi:hypothetical protein
MLWRMSEMLKLSTKNKYDITDTRYKYTDKDKKRLHFIQSGSMDLTATLILVLFLMILMWTSMNWLRTLSDSMQIIVLVAMCGVMCGICVSALHIYQAAQTKMASKIICPENAEVVDCHITMYDDKITFSIKDEEKTIEYANFSYDKKSRLRYEEYDRLIVYDGKEVVETFEASEILLHIFGIIDDIQSDYFDVEVDFNDAEEI